MKKDFLADYKLDQATKSFLTADLSRFIESATEFALQFKHGAQSVNGFDYRLVYNYPYLSLFSSVSEGHCLMKQNTVEALRLAITRICQDEMRILTDYR